MTRAPGSKHGNDNFCELIYCVLRNFIFFGRMSIISQECVYALNVCTRDCVCMYMCVCACMCVCIGVNVCALLVHVHVYPSKNACFCVCMCMFV